MSAFTPARADLDACYTRTSRNRPNTGNYVTMWHAISSGSFAPARCLRMHGHEMAAWRMRSGG